MKPHLNWTDNQQPGLITSNQGHPSLNHTASNARTLNIQQQFIFHVRCPRLSRTHLSTLTYSKAHSCPHPQMVPTKNYPKVGVDFGIRRPHLDRSCKSTARASLIGSSHRAN
eukprot:353624-Chlamydomonas_euryale.AAC.10